MNYDDDLSPLPELAGSTPLDADAPVPSLSADETAKLHQAAQVQQQIAQQQAFQSIPEDVLKFIVKFHQAGACSLPRLVATSRVRPCALCSRCRSRACFPRARLQQSKAASTGAGSLSRGVRSADMRLRLLLSPPSQSRRRTWPR